MIVKMIQDEDFVNYKIPSMFISSKSCDWKCCRELGVGTEMCQNSIVSNQKNINISEADIYKRYINNNITSAIVIGGLEPMIQFDEVFDLISYFRKNKCNDVFVLYTGYYKNEIPNEIERLIDLKNIIIKFGRFIPNQCSHYDEILGVNLASDNQYAERIS